MINAVVTKFERKILKRSEPNNLHTKSAVILFSSMVMLIMADAQLLMRYKGWTFVQSVYFWFITFTTIGFGDYVAGLGSELGYLPERIKVLSINDSMNHFNKDESVGATITTIKTFIGIFVFLIYMLGLCIVSAVISCIMATMEERKHHSRCLGCVPRKRQADVDVNNEQNNSPDQCDIGMANLGKQKVGFQEENVLSLSVTDIK